MKFVYFGGDPIGAPILESLLAAGYKPELVVCNPDRPVGRKGILTAPAVKEVAVAHDIPVYQPESLRDEAAAKPIFDINADLYVVVAYNHILPEWLINHPSHQTLNMHPSLLPKLRGMSPIRSAILRDEPEAVGVTVIRLDTKMDHGAIIAQHSLAFDELSWPIDGQELDRRLATLGGQLLIDTLPEYVAGTISPTEQDHDAATYCGKISKTDGELTIDPYDLPRGKAAWQALLKIRALAGWPETFFYYHDKRIKIKDAELAENGSLRITRITPEGRSEMDFATYFSKT